MRLPNKFISYDESILSKLPIILKILSKSNHTVKKLYNKTMNNFESIDEFIEAIDCLFILNKIYINEMKEIVYVKGN